MGTKQGSKNKKWWKVFLGISAATIVAVGATVGICYAIWHKQKTAETAFNVSCTNPNLTFNTTDELSLTWTSANYTPTNFTLKSDGSSNTNWTLTPLNNHQMTLSRKSQTLALGTYPVTFVASDGTNEKEATISVTVIVPIPSTYYLGIKTNNDVILGQVTATLNLGDSSLKYLYISPNSVIQILNCSTNQLTQLDVSHNSQLQYLYCSTNQLQQLDVSNNSQLTDLYCFSNPLNLIKLPTNMISGSFTFTPSPTINSWTAYQYATTGNIYCNASLTVNNLPSTWTRHNS